MSRPLTFQPSDIMTFFQCFDTVGLAEKGIRPVESIPLILMWHNSRKSGQ